MPTAAALTPKLIRLPRSRAGWCVAPQGLRQRFRRFVERGDWEARCLDAPALDRLCLAAVTLAGLYFALLFVAPLLR